MIAANTRGYLSLLSWAVGVWLSRLKAERKTKILYPASNSDIESWRTGGPTYPLSTQGLARHLYVIDVQLVSAQLNKSPQSLLSVTQLG